MLTFRKATIDDAPAMADVQSRSWVAAYTGIIPDELIAEKNAKRCARITERLAAPAHEHYVAELDGRIVGMGAFAPTERAELAGYFEIGSLYLDPEVFRRGLGRKFMGYALDLAHAGNHSGALLYVLEKNAPARRFYEACGFAPDGAQNLWNGLISLRYVMKF